MRVRTFLGVDLAVRPLNTGVAVLEVSEHALRATLARDVATDDASLLSLVDRHTVVGLDAPLGWPVDFVKAVTRHTEFDSPQSWDVTQLRFRDTDRFVTDLTGSAPLSVSADLIGAVAMRAAALQAQWATTWGALQPRDGTGQLVEVYPRPALRVWQLLDERATYKGASSAFKRAEQRATRESIMEALARRAPWLDVAPDLVESCVASDHSLDALISALVAFASTRGETWPPPSTQPQAKRARVEGWIHVPRRALDFLAPSHL